MRRKFRFMIRIGRVSPHGTPSIAFGGRIGYWPCLQAPFLQVSFLRWHIDLWHGLPSKEMVERGDA